MIRFISTPCLLNTLWYFNVAMEKHNVQSFFVFVTFHSYLKKKKQRVQRFFQPLELVTIFTAWHAEFWKDLHASQRHLDFVQPLSWQATTTFRMGPGYQGLGCSSWFKGLIETYNGNFHTKPVADCCGILMAVQWDMVGMQINDF